LQQYYSNRSSLINDCGEGKFVNPVTSLSNSYRHITIWNDLCCKTALNSWANLNSWAMENKYITLQTIYDIVKDDAHPTSTIVFPNEVIVRQNFPWDESVKYLDELCSENLVEIIQLSPAVIYLTDKGFQYIRSSKRSRHVA